MEVKTLDSMRVNKINHIVVSSNKESTIKLIVKYNGQLPVIARLIDTTKKLETSLLLDYIQLIISEKQLTETKFHECGK